MTKIIIIEHKSFKKAKAKNDGKIIKEKFVDYLEAYNIVINSNKVNNFIEKEIEQMQYDRDHNIVAKKDKNYFRKRKSLYENIIHEVVIDENLTIKNLTINEFIIKATEELVGYDVIAEIYYDKDTTDIFLLGKDKIFYENKKKGQTPVRADIKFRDDTHYKVFIERLMKESGHKPLDVSRNKIVDFELYGDRYNAIHNVIAVTGIALTIRKHSDSPVVFEDLLEYKCVNELVAEYINVSIEGELNGIIGGITGSGKSTTLRAFIDYAVTKTNKRMLVCEDTRELQPKNEHTLELQTHKNDDKSLSVTLNDLLILALRQKPKYIMVGEVRGLEAETMVEAMSTGHSTYTTMHGGKSEDIINRLITKYLYAMPSISSDVAERTIATAIDIIIIQRDIPKIGRRVVELTEINYNYKEKSISYNKIMEFDVKKKDFVFKSKFSGDIGRKLLLAGIEEERLLNLVDWDASYTGI